MRKCAGLVLADQNMESTTVPGATCDEETELLWGDMSGVCPRDGYEDSGGDKELLAREQIRLRRLVVEQDTEQWQIRPHFSGLERVGGVDLSFIKGDSVNACAQLVVLSYPNLKVLYKDSQMVALTAPYIAGFLAFRETPFLLEALKRLKNNKPELMPQVVFADGNGLYHYREFGLACHLGVLSGLPCIGVAKNLLEVDSINKKWEHKLQIAALQKGGDSFPLINSSGKVLGKALRSSEKSSKPVYVSIGHKISLDTAVRLTHSCCRYRVPEPIRQADYHSREYLRLHFPAADT
ncbi:endonuclease V-like [Eucyclogobius newberryi]|uniref:endonuclease V-like n=1 Tax=Eucyclogobius newberryi TaxID=166745 RepID=UPI003B5A4683